MDIICTLVGIFSAVFMLSAKVSTKVQSCEGPLPNKDNEISPCNAVLHEPVCLICNRSRSLEDITWFVDDKMLADKGHNFDANHAGGLVDNGCFEYEKYSLRLERPTEENHNSLYYCQRNTKNVSVLILKLHADTHLSINTSKASNGRLILGFKESTQLLQCVVITEAPRVLLIWSLNHVSKGRTKFNRSSTGSNTYSYTYNFSNLKTDDTITCSSEGMFITSDSVSLKIYVLDKEKESTSGTRNKPHTTPTDVEYRRRDWHKIWIPTGLIFALLSFLAVIIYRHHRMKNSFHIAAVTSNNFSEDNGESGGSINEPYSLVGNAVDTEDESNGVARMSLLSKVKSSGIYEYWTGTYSRDGIEKDKCFAKSLSGQATLQEASQFQALAKRVKCLKDSTSIVRLLCINTEENPFSMVYELLEYGTLRDFVMSRYQQQPTSVRGTAATNLQTQILELLTFATNVANAMVFVESQNFRHPVLSLKKVLLTAQCCCKLYDICPSDMAMTKIEEVRKKSHPPTPWMSPETIFLHQYSLASDVWSYSTLLWELFSLGEAPYAGKHSKDIEDKVRKGVFLSQPPNCPGAVYGIMLLAWAKVGKARPSFQVMLEKLQDILQSTGEEDTSDTAQYFTLKSSQTNEYI